MFPTSDRTERLGKIVDRTAGMLRRLDLRPIDPEREQVVNARQSRLWQAYRASYLADRAKSVFAEDPI